MNVEIVVYDGFDELDAIAPYELLSNVRRVAAGFTVGLVALEAPTRVTAAHGLVVDVPGALSARPDLLIVPGGGWADRAPTGARAEAERGALPAAIADRHAAGTVIASVCTGAMLLAAGGLLAERPATTHHVALDDLRAAGARVIDARVVDDGDLITAGGVTSGLDLALWVVERFLGPRAALTQEVELEYERRGTVWRASWRP